MSTSTKKTTKTTSKVSTRKPAKSSEAAKKPTSISKAPISAAGAGTLATKAAKPTLVEKPQPVVLGPVMRKKELIDTVVTRTGLKKKDAKPVIEGMLAVLGEALAEGRELILPPLGKVVVRKEKKLPNGKVMIVKVRQSSPPVPATPPEFSDAAE